MCWGFWLCRRFANKGYLLAAAAVGGLLLAGADVGGDIRDGVAPIEFLDTFGESGIGLGGVGKVKSDNAVFAVHFDLS